MNLAHLKMALSRFPADMDDIEVIIASNTSEGESDYDCLGAVATPDMESPSAIILLTNQAMKAHVEKGKARMQDGSPIELPPEDQGG